MHDLGQHQADLQDYQAHLFQLYILELLPNRSWLVGHFRYMLYRGFTDRSFQNESYHEWTISKRYQWNPDLEELVTLNRYRNKPILYVQQSSSNAKHDDA